MARKRANAISKRSFSMPELSELYGKPPFHYREITQHLVQFRTTPQVLRSLIPAPLVPNRENCMFVSVADFLCSGFGRYYEAHVFAHATYKRRLVNFSIYLVLDNDVAICGGREIWGFPKKLGQLDMSMTDDVMRSTVERGGMRVIDMAVRMSTMTTAEEMGGTAEWVARKFIPNVSLSAPPDVDQLTTTTLTNMEVSEIHCGPATLEFGRSPADQLSTIPIEEVTGGWYYKSACTLEDGAVLHDYLT